MLLWASPSDDFHHLLQSLMSKCLHFSSHCRINIWWWVNAFVAGALFQCLASPCVVYFHITRALCCADANHFGIIPVPLWYGPWVWRKINLILYTQVSTTHDWSQDDLPDTTYKHFSSGTSTNLLQQYIQFYLTLKSTVDQFSLLCGCLLASKWIFHQHDRGLAKCIAGSYFLHFVHNHR